MGGNEYFGETAQLLPGQRVKLDIKDFKILNILSENGRYTCSSIAKKVRLSREVTAYRLNRLFHNKVINGVVTMIDPRPLGFIKYDIYLRFQKVSEQKEQEIIQKIGKINEVAWIATFGGNYDLSVQLIVKSIDRFDEILKGILAVCGDYLSNYMILNVIKEGAIPHNLFGNRIELAGYKGKPDGSFQKELESPKKIENTVKLNSSDKTILNILAMNGRVGLTDISEKTGLSPNTISYRIKKLIGNGIITDFISVPSYPLLGLEWNIVLVKFKNLTPENESKFLRFIKEHPYIDYYRKVVGNWNYHISVLAKDQMHLRKMLMELREVFKDTLQEYESLRVFNQYKFLILPGDVFGD